MSDKCVGCANHAMACERGPGCVWYECPSCGVDRRLFGCFCEPAGTSAVANGPLPTIDGLSAAIEEWERTAEPTPEPWVMLLHPTDDWFEALRAPAELVEGPQLPLLRGELGFIDGIRIVHEPSAGLLRVNPMSAAKAPAKEPPGKPSDIVDSQIVDRGGRSWLVERRRDGIVREVRLKPEETDAGDDGADG